MISSEDIAYIAGLFDGEGSIHFKRTVEKKTKICEVCRGNGFVRVPYEQAREEQWADCEFCNSQGEVEIDETRH